jgi:hypothetical protein
VIRAHPIVSDEIRALADSELLERFTTSHHAVLGFIRRAVLHARDAGEILTEIKRRVPRGQWLLWLKDHQIGFSTAANYIRVFERWSEVEANLQDDANFTLTDALKLLAARRKPREEAPAQQALPDGPLYTMPMIADWITVLRTMPPDQRARSRDALIQLRDEINSIVGQAVQR